MLNSGRNRTALVLAGGGSRGAYQSGVLLGISEICKTEMLPFSILTGISAGSMNASYLASHVNHFALAAQGLASKWATIRTHNVFQVNHSALAKNGLQWVANLMLGGLGRGISFESLLNNAPISSWIQTEVDFNQVRLHIANGALHAVAFTATNFSSGNSVTFFDGEEHIEPWFKRERMGIRTKDLSHVHVVASAAIPVLFPLSKIDGDFYGDGGVRMLAPLSAAVHLGAQKVMAIGTSYRNRTTVATEKHVSKYPGIGDMMGVFFQAVFGDVFENDLERFEVTNQILSKVPDGQSIFRRIPMLVFRPSKNPSLIAAEVYEQAPSSLKRFFETLSGQSGKASELLSFLSFDQSFTQPLVELGFQDALARKDEIEAFLNL